MRDVLRTAAVMALYRVQRWDCDLVVGADDDEFAYGPSVQLVFRDTSYVELPAAWDGKSFRLADARERAYVAGKSEVTSATDVIRIVDDQRIYFVACTHLEIARVR